MRIVQLTEQEAANSAVMENVSRYLLTGAPMLMQQEVTREQEAVKVLYGEPRPPRDDVPTPPAPISVDAPDVGVEQPEVPVASPFASIGFGTAAPSPTTAPAASVPSLPPGVETERRASVVQAPVAKTLSHAGLDLDKNGLFWDERIHSSSKDKNADGTWRKKRGVEKTLGAEGVARVEAEIRAVLAIPGPAVVPPVPAVPTVPAVPEVPAVPAAAAAAADEDPATAFMRWMEYLTPAMQPGGAFTPELMNKLLAAQGLPNEAGLMAFVQRPDLVPAARAMLDTWMADPSKVPA